ncbi:TIR domain-containing protein [Streptomyces xanthochromogenes]|uniref:TIR domain-containing protein n=1 Tax=Streptomyces xanthochromogenes TaxID=67384 RepID=UPI0034444701
MGAAMGDGRDELQEAPADGGRPLKVFVSYSRRDFHSAEAVTAALWAHEPLNPWFDLQRLRPGTDWEAAWDDALETADALLLLASPAAIASEYVRLEWSRALERGIPVYVGVIAGTDVPPELAGYPVHDLRVRFWQRSHVLGEEIVRTGTRLGSEPSSEEPRTGWLVPQRLPWPRVPASIVAFVVCATIMGAALVWASVLLVRLDISVWHLAERSPFEASRVWRGRALNGVRLGRWHVAQFSLLTMTVMAAPFGPAVLAVAGGLARRSCGWVSLVVAVGAAGAVTAVCGYGVRAVLALPDIGDPTVAKEVWPTPPAVTEEGAAVVRVLAVAAVAAVVCLGCALWSRWFYLWLPAGMGVAYQRRRVTEVPHVASGPRRRTVRPSRNPGLRAGWREMRQLAHEPRPDAGQPEGRRRDMDQRFLREWRLLCKRNGVGQGRPVGNVRLQVRCPAGADESMAELLRTAFRLAGVGASSAPDMEAVAPNAGWTFVLVSSHVDWADVAEAIEEGAPRTICVLLDQVAIPADTGALRRYQWLDFREQRPEHLFALVEAVCRPDSAPGLADPIPVPVVADRFRAPLAPRVLVSVFRAIAAFPPGFALARLIFAPTSTQSTALAVLAVASTAALLRMADRLAARRLTPAQLTRSYAVALVLTVLWCATGASILWTPVRPPGVVEAFLPKDLPGAGLFVVYLLAGLGWYVAALVLAPLPAFSPARRSWLPTAKGPWPRRPRRAALSSWDGCTLLLAWLLFAIGLFLYMNCVQVFVGW